MSEHTIQFTCKARYHTAGRVDKYSRRIIIALHGYGQLAQYFLKNFDSLLDGHTLIVAPEGLSLFYLQGFQGRVGATWMTKENRLQSIENYVAYLQQLYQNLDKTYDLTGKEVILLGFSQGVSTLLRWIISSSVPYDKLVLWAGSFPEELYQTQHRIFPGKPVYFVYGRQDPFIDTIDVEAQLKRLQPGSMSLQIVSFDGKHEIRQDILQAILK